MENLKSGNIFFIGLLRRSANFQSSYLILENDTRQLSTIIPATEDATLHFPSKLDFLEVFGIEPVETDLSIGMCRYIKNSKTSGKEIDI